MNEFHNFLQFIDDKKISKDDFGNWDDIKNTIKEFDLDVEVVDQQGGEGEGDDAHIVVHFPNRNLYVKLEGYYASYSGFEWDYGNYYEVKPKEKTITVYE